MIVRNIPFKTLSLMTREKFRTRLYESESEAEEPTNYNAEIKHYDRFILPVLLLKTSNNVVF